MRSGRKVDMVGFLGANKIIGSDGITPFTARSFYQSTMSPQRSSYGAYNLGSTRHGDAPQDIAIPTCSSSIGTRAGRQT